MYIDAFIDRVISRLEREKNWKSSVYYLSDHGESLGENGIYLHSTPYAIAPAEQTRIPMVLWLSDAWQTEADIDFTCLQQQAKSGQYSHDHFFHTVAGIFDLQTSVYRKELDIMAACRR